MCSDLQEALEQTGLILHTGSSHTIDNVQIMGNCIFWILTNIWRWRDEGVALGLCAAVGEKAFEGARALLPEVIFGKTSPLLSAVNPGVEAVVSSARSVDACAFVVLAGTQQLLILRVVKALCDREATV